VKPGINEIRPYLKWLNTQPSRPEGGEQSKGDGCLAAPAVRSTYQQGVFLSRAMNHSCFPSKMGAPHQENYPKFRQAF
jgi:hypothetical protein